MIELSDIRVFLCTIPTKMNYSFDTLMGLAQRIFDEDPLSGHLFLFVSRQRDRLKILFWDHDGLAIFYKKLESYYPHFFLFTEIGECANNLACRPASAG
jgi:transposase